MAHLIMMALLEIMMMTLPPLVGARLRFEGCRLAHDFQAQAGNHFSQDMVVQET